MTDLTYDPGGGEPVSLFALAARAVTEPAMALVWALRHR